MTKEELMNDSAEFKGKEGFGYVHAELKDASQCALFINGHAPAIEALAYELINRLAEDQGMPLGMYLAIMMARHEMCQAAADDGDDTLEIE